MRHLHQVERAGESASTPWIAIAGLVVFFAALGLLMFGIVEAPADATIDQTSFYTDEAGKGMMSVPEAAQSFQITFPDNGIGGLVLKPWNEQFAITVMVQLVPLVLGDGCRFTYRRPVLDPLVDLGVGPADQIRGQLAPGRKLSFVLQTPDRGSAQTRTFNNFPDSQ